MYYNTGINNNIKLVLSGKANYTLIPLIVLSVFVSVLLYIAFQMQQGLLSLLVVVSLLLVFLIINYPKFWIYTVIGFTFVYFKETSGGISPVDYASAVLYSGSLLVWITWMKLVKRVKITDSAADWLIILFYVCFILNFIVALANGNDMLGWLREALRGIIILYFIPIKYYFSDNKDLKKLFFVFGISVIISATWQFYDYYKALQLDAVYLFQLATGVRLNQALFSAAAVFGFSFLIFFTKMKNQLFAFLVTSLSVAGLFTSFSRSFWLTIGLNTFIIFLFVPIRKKVKIIIYVFMSLAVLVTVMNQILGDKSKYMGMIVENRVGSSFKGKKDVSVDMRLVEYKSVFARIAENPLGGNGMGSKIKFYHSGNKATTLTHNIHNSYLFTAQRYGIPLAIVFFAAILLYLIKSFKLAISIKDKMDKMLILGAFNTLLMLIITSFVTAIFYYRDGSVVTALTLAVVGIIDNRYRNIKGEQNYGR